MHLGKGVLAPRGLFAAALVLSLVLPRAVNAADDPLAFASGIWRGEADNGHAKFKITVTLKKVNSTIYGSYKARSRSGEQAEGGFDAVPAGKGRTATVHDSTLRGINFEVTAIPKSGLELEVSSLMGGGTLKFGNDFTKCELVFQSMVTAVTATLYRTYPPPAKKKDAGGQSGKKAPALPPLVIVK